MPTNSYPEHSIPNAFMASSPSHPFWLDGPIARALKAFNNATLGTAEDPEHLTGPVALWESEKAWNAKRGGGSGIGKKGKVVVLDESVVYPYS